LPCATATPKLKDQYGAVEMQLDATRF